MVKCRPPSSRRIWSSCRRLASVNRRLLPSVVEPAGQEEERRLRIEDDLAGLHARGEVAHLVHHPVAEERLLYLASRRLHPSPRRSRRTRGSCLPRCSPCSVRPAGPSASRGTQPPSDHSRRCTRRRCPSNCRRRRTFVSTALSVRTLPHGVRCPGARQIAPTAD